MGKCVYKLYILYQIREIILYKLFVHEKE